MVVALTGTAAAKIRQTVLATGEAADELDSMTRAGMKLTADLLRFEQAVVAKCRERGLAGDDQIPDEVVAEVVRDLYGEDLRPSEQRRVRKFIRHIEREEGR